jgi:hypothetical protein
MTANVTVGTAQGMDLRGKRAKDEAKDEEIALDVT